MDQHYQGPPTRGRVSVPRRPRFSYRLPSARFRAAAFAVGLAAALVAEGHRAPGLQLPLLFAVAGITLSIVRRSFGRLSAGLGRNAARQEAAFFRRLASVCRQGDFPQRQERIAELASFVARKAGLDRVDQKMLKTAASLHRIGRATLPPCLGCDQDTMERRAGDLAARLLDGPTALHRAARDMAAAQHESWDGSGLPNQLRGSEIPFVARLLHVALALDALLPRAGFVPDRDALRVITARVAGEAGLTLDPALADLPLRHLDLLESLLHAHAAETDRIAPSRAASGWWTRLGAVAGSASMSVTA